MAHSSRGRGNTHLLPLTPPAAPASPQARMELGLRAGTLPALEAFSGMKCFYRCLLLLCNMSCFLISSSLCTWYLGVG